MAGSSFSLNGDFKGLGRLIEKMGVLKDGSFRRAAVRQVGEEALYQVQRGFVDQRSPFSEPWKPSERAIEQGGKTLEDTLRLRNSINLRVESTGFSVGTNVAYANIHNRGGVITYQARTELRRYKISGSDKRKRVKFNSKASRSATTTANYGGHTVRMPPRQFLPYAGQMPPIYRSAFQEVLQDLAHDWEAQ